MKTRGAHDTARITYLADYRPPEFRIDATELRFELGAESTRVRARLEVTRVASGDDAPLQLDGEDLTLEDITVNGSAPGRDQCEIGATGIRLHGLRRHCRIDIANTIHPRANTRLMGLYESGGALTTQCEAEGFRRITYFPDRPDVLSVYTTTLIGDRERYPVMLSNGNLIDRGDAGGGQHWVRWHDPYPKPSYLFAVVAGDFARLDDEFVTRSGRRVALSIFCGHRDIGQCRYAMVALQKAMAWDEQRFRLEYDLDRYMIVAVDEFNMGAMENKGLNIFNTRYILATPATATDEDYQGIDGVVAHEYFHNWSGNRVTCRDWFQLSLKEGFTVFRDQQFSADHWSRGVKRIEDANLVRVHQFREDAGPLAHPVRPAAYEEVNNFYTLTVYNKGAEVIRMLHTLLGWEGFRRGVDAYFRRYDGSAVTVEDFVRALAESNDVDLDQFMCWYTQAGTPVLTVGRRYEPQTRTYEISVTQACPASPDQAEKAPFHLPLSVALLRRDGTLMPLTLEGEDPAAGSVERVLEIRQREHRFRFTNICDEPVPSLLRGFSAPVRIDAGLTDDELRVLMQHDTDDFNRWDAAQELATREIVRLATCVQNRTPVGVNHDLVNAYGTILGLDHADRAFQAEAMRIPAYALIAARLPVIDPDAVESARRAVARAIACSLNDLLSRLYRELADDSEHRVDAASVGRRRLRNLCLGYLLELETAEAVTLCLRQYETATNMTDRMAALTGLANSDCAARGVVIDDFYQRYRRHPLVVDKWFAVQAQSRTAGSAGAVRALCGHPEFHLRNPNRVRALLGSFSHGNPRHFHAPDGAGYRLVAGKIRELDALNPQIAARLATAFQDWRRYDSHRARRMREALAEIADAPGLSTDVHEVVAKSLAD